MRHHTPEHPSTEDIMAKRRRMGWFVLISIAVFSVVLGVFSFRMYQKSEKHLLTAVAEMEGRGKELSVEQCVDEVFRWYPNCEAMSSLCDGSVVRMTGACVAAQNRKDYCDALGESVKRDDFGQQECEARINLKDRSARKMCGNTYAAISFYCRNELWAPRQTGS